MALLRESIAKTSLIQALKALRLKAFRRQAKEVCSHTSDHKALIKLLGGLIDVIITYSNLLRSWTVDLT